MSFRYANQDALYGLCQASTGLRSYLEVGTFSGGSLEVVLDHAPELNLLAVCDLWDGQYGQLPRYTDHSHISALLERKRYAGQVLWMDGDSHVLLSQFRVKYEGILFDLIHIDGDHSFVGALEDLRDAWPLLKLGGAMVVDDLTHTPEVYRAVEIFFDRTEECLIEMLELEKESGCAILRKFR